MKRYRYVMPTRTGRWQPTREAAEDAAVRAGFGHRAEYDPGPGKRRAQFYADPLLKFEDKEVEEPEG